MAEESFTINRRDLEKFLPDLRAVRAFERLLKWAPIDAQDFSASIEEATLTAGSAYSTALHALRQIPARPEYVGLACNHDMTPAAINTPYAIEWDDDLILPYRIIGDPPFWSEIYFFSSGYFSVRTTVQFASSDPGTVKGRVWLRLSGTDVPFTAVETSLHANTPTQTVTINSAITAAPLDILEVMYSVDNTNLIVSAIAGGGSVPDTVGASIVVERMNAD